MAAPEIRNISETEITKVAVVAKKNLDPVRKIQVDSVAHRHNEPEHVRVNARSMKVRPDYRHLYMKMFLDVFRDHFSVEKVYDPVCIIGIVRRVRNHDDGCSFLV